MFLFETNDNHHSSFYLQSLGQGVPFGFQWISAISKKNIKVDTSNAYCSMPTICHILIFDVAKT